MDEKDKEALATIQAFIETNVKAGFESEKEVVRAALDYMEGEADPAFLLPRAKRFAREAFQRLRNEQPTWPKITDCDRLDAAFEELERNGIISRQNFSCCLTCGSYEIGDEMQKAADSGRDVRGYTFYHMQDTENAAAGGDIFLCYGAVDEPEEARIALANEIVSTIKKYGLDPVWNGDLGRRIQVPLDWKRRREFPADTTFLDKLRSFFN